MTRRFVPVSLVLAAVLLGADRAAPVVEETAYFAGGCFWGIEAVFEHIRGVSVSESGYSGGTKKSPSYEDVSTGQTGHAEAVRVVFDPARVSYRQLLRVFFTIAHDPTQLNRQDPDDGPQYRSALFYANDAQQRQARSIIDSLTNAKTFKRPIVTQVVPYTAFYMAEAYHQDYLVHHPTQPYIVYYDAPKLVHLKKAFPELYVDR